MKTLLQRISIILLVLLSLLAFSLGNGRTPAVSALGSSTHAAGPGSALQGFRWEMTVQLSPQEQQSMLRNRGTALPALQAQGVTAAIKNSTLTLNGQDSLDQMRAALFNGASPMTDFLSGPVELALYMPADGTPVTLNLEARVTTGARWEVVDDPGSLYTATTGSTFETRYQAYGAPSIQTIQLQPKASGTTTVRLVYHRTFGPPEATHAKLDVWLAAVDRMIEISNPNPAAPKADVSAATTASTDPYAGLLPQVVPSSWDWRNYGIVPGVRDQGNCGSCWAFGTVGAMESAIAKAGGGLTDLSEQFLVSCNWDGWGCGGGQTASKYHYDTLGQNQSQVGAVLESADPYTSGSTGQDGTCTAYGHPYKLASWSFVNNGNGGSHPTVAQIKDAIYTYGPVAAGVCAEFSNWNGHDYSGWADYTNGVYDPPLGTADNNCLGDINHMIVIVGWDDTTSPPSWIIRNSWGPYWGENGYMHLAYDPNYTTSHIGEGASWVTAQPPALPPTVYRPNGNTYTATPTFSWSQMSGVSSYSLKVYDTVSRTYPVSAIVSDASCSASSGLCSYTSPVKLGLSRRYQWKVASGSGSYASPVNFTVLPGINSQFNGNSTGWLVRPGATWSRSASTYFTNGVPGKWSSTSYNATFNNFTYEVNMNRVDTSSQGWASGLIVRGLPRFDSAGNWKAGYEFLYTSEYQDFSVWKSVGSGWTALQPWTYTGAIASNAWNRLKVTADGNQLFFYINGTLVWSGSDTALSNGQVGVVMDQGSGGGRLDVDWATLGMPDPSTETLTGAAQPGQVQLGPAGGSNSPERAR